MEILDRYIQRLLEQSTPQAPVWNLENIRAGKESHWNYMDGCVIKAVLDLYDITGQDAYLRFADTFTDYFVREDGSIRTYRPENYSLDDVNAGKTLFDLHRLTGKEKYRKGLDTIYAQLATQPRTKSGNFWHKKIYPHQIWLDGLYMAQPLYMQYERDYNASKNCMDSYRQFLTVYDTMRDARTGLYYHALDTSRQMFWCDPVTGLSMCCWLRALGWYAMALVDTWAVTPASMAAEAARLAEIFRELIDAALRYQSADGRWYQVVNFGGIAPNYLETSGSAILSYAILKGVRLGLLPGDYFAHGKRAFDSICEHCLSEQDGELQLDGICLVAGLGNTEHREGTFDYYMREPIVKGEAKGVAPLMMAYTELLRRDQ